MNAIGVQRPIRALLRLASLALLLPTGPAGAAEPYMLRSDFLWFVSGHGVNLSQIVDGDGSPFDTTKFASVAEVPPAARAKIDDVRGAIVRLQAPGEHILPAGYGPGTNADLIAASLLSKLGGVVDASEIDLVVGIDLTTGAERLLMRASHDGSLFNFEGGDIIAATFLPLYSIGQNRVRIHFKSDSQYHPPIDRTALAPFGNRKLPGFGSVEIEGMPVSVLARSIPRP